MQPSLFQLHLIRRSYDAFKAQWGTVIGAYFIAMVLSIMISATQQTASAVFWLMGVILWLPAQLASSALQLGLSYIALTVAEGKAAGVEQLFQPYRLALRYFGASLAYGLMILAGTIFFIVPGIILALVYSQYIYLMLDKNLNIAEAFGTSARMTKGHRWQMVGLGLLMMLAFIGLFMPLTVAVMSESIPMMIVAALFILIGFAMLIPTVLILNASIYVALRTLYFGESGTTPAPVPSTPSQFVPYGAAQHSYIEHASSYITRDASPQGVYRSLAPVYIGLFGFIAILLMMGFWVATQLPEQLRPHEQTCVLGADGECIESFILSGIVDQTHKETIGESSESHSLYTGSVAGRYVLPASTPYVRGTIPGVSYLYLDHVPAGTFVDEALGFSIDLPTVFQSYMVIKERNDAPSDSGLSPVSTLTFSVDAMEVETWGETTYSLFEIRVYVDAVGGGNAPAGDPYRSLGQAFERELGVSGGYRFVIAESSAQCPERYRDGRADETPHCRVHDAALTEVADTFALVP